MSTVPHEVASTTGGHMSKSFFEYHGADIILRSQDGYHFRLPKALIINSSPILGELIRRTLDFPCDSNLEGTIPVVDLLDGGEVLRCLLTFVFLVTPLVPSTPEGIMELLCAAQKYQMGDALTHIRGSIARQNLFPTGLEPALHIYALAQNCGLRSEALQTARIISRYPLTIEGFENKLDAMSGASLYELWKYHKSLRAILASDLTEFRTSRARGTLKDLLCEQYSPRYIPRWLDQYIESIGEAPNLFDLIEFNTAMARHLQNENVESCKCASISSQTIRKFWDALASVVHGSFEKAELAPSLVREQLEREDHQMHSETSPIKPFDVPDANFIIRSSDFVDFRVHKPVLAMASPFFKDLLSLPQPSDSETVGGLPVVHLSESSELLNSLISILYPIPTVMPNSYEKVLYLLSACQKYDMHSVQSSIRAEVSRGASPVPKGADAFTAYAIASAKKLIPEMENAARLTLDHPMTFDNIGESLRLFEGWALRDLVNFRNRCRDDLVACLDLFLDARPSGLSKIWLTCPKRFPGTLPTWLSQTLLRNQNDLKLQTFVHPLDVHLRIRRECFAGFQFHTTCKFCLAMHIKEGPTFYAELENKLAQALDKS